CPTNDGESGPGGQGGITRACVTARISCAHLRASPAVVSGNGAIPPSVWQPAHLPAKIGATFAYVTRGPPRTAQTVAVKTRQRPSGTSTARSRRIGPHTSGGRSEVGSGRCALRATETTRGPWRLAPRVLCLRAAAGVPVS